LAKSKTNLKKRISFYLSTGWVTSGYSLTLISLIILPFIIVIITDLNDIVYKELLNYVPDFGYSTTTQVFLYTSLIFSYGFFIYIIFLFPPYPFPISIEKYFKERGFENAVIEFEFVKKIMYFAVPIFLILTFLPTIKEKIEYFTSQKLSLLEDRIFNLIAIYSLFISFSGLLKMVFVQLRKKFRLYFAKGCFILLSNTIDEVEKVYYFKKGLNSYNKYIQKNLHLSINNLDKIYSMISFMSVEKKNQIFKSLSFAFLDKNIDIHTLEPMRVLQKDLPTLFPLDKTETYLTQQPVLNKIKDNVAFLLTITPLIISIIEIYNKIK
jgi:hypothetical protein